MRAYLMTTGIIFALIVAAHVARAVSEGAVVARDPWFIALTLVAAGLSAWAWRLLRTIARP